MTLRRRLLLVFLGLAVGPIAAIAGALTWGTLRFAEKRAQEDCAGRLSALSARIEREIAAERDGLEAVVAEWTALYSMVPGTSLDRWLGDWMHLQERQGQLSPAIARWLLIEPGRPDALLLERYYIAGGFSSRASHVPLRALPASYHGLLGGERVPSAGAGLETTWRPEGTVLTLAVPVRRGAVSPAVLIEEIAAPLFLEELVRGSGRQGLDACWVAAPTGQSWRFLSHTDPTLIGLPIAEDPTVPAAWDAGSWRFDRSGDTLRVAGGLQDTGWRIGGSFSLAPVFGPLRQAIGVALLLLTLMTALVVVAILFVTRGIGRAVEEIAESTAAIARGDLEHTPRLARSDEFGAIAEHVRQMARELVITAESRSIARLSARLVHGLKGVASQLRLMLYNLKENYDDPEFRAEVMSLMQELADEVESLALRLRRGGEESEPVWERVDLDGVVRKVAASVGAAWPSVEVRLDLRSPGEILSSEELLVEVLENIVTNALEAMDGQGTLTVRTSPLGRASVAAAGSSHSVEIEDTGPGMSQEFIERHLFQPFTTTKPKGIGLGMYQVRQAVTRLRGRLEVRSRPGAGTQVRIEIGRPGEG